MVLKAMENDRRKLLALCHDEFLGSRSDTVRQNSPIAFHWSVEMSSNISSVFPEFLSDEDYELHGQLMDDSLLSFHLITLVPHNSETWLRAEEDTCPDNRRIPVRSHIFQLPLHANVRTLKAEGLKELHSASHTLVTEFDCPQIITSTIARLRTEHLKGMKIHPDKTRSYVQCKHCPDLQLTPNHILECPTVATKLLKMGMVPLRDSLRELLYSPDAPRIAEAVIKTFDGI
ncbi:hypothetical protein TNCV_2394951 [Trichonephila clavipes]|nr:hypothetical protein TNCV_2394951 [Trichonephila clavipes]